MTYSGGQAVGVEAGQETPIITVSHSEYHSVRYH